MLGSSQRAAEIHHFGLHPFLFHSHQQQLQQLQLQQQQQQLPFKQEVSDSCFFQGESDPQQRSVYVLEQQQQQQRLEPTSVLDLWSPSPSSTRGFSSSNKRSPDNRSNSSEKSTSVELWRSNVEVIAEREGRRSRDKSLDEWLADLQQQKLIQEDDQEQEDDPDHLTFKAAAAAASSSSDRRAAPQYGIDELESLLLSPCSSSAPAPLSHLAKWLLGDFETTSSDQFSSIAAAAPPKAEADQQPDAFFSGKTVNPFLHQFQDPPMFSSSFPTFLEQPLQGDFWSVDESESRKRKAPAPLHQLDNSNKVMLQMIQQQHQQQYVQASPAFAVPLVAEQPPPPTWGAPRKIQRVHSGGAGDGTARGISGGIPAISPNPVAASVLPLPLPSPAVVAEQPAVCSALPTTTVSVPDEGGLGLMDQLLQLAQAIDVGSTSAAQTILARLNQHLFSHHHQGKRIQRLAFYFKEALADRLSASLSSSNSSSPSLESDQPSPWSAQRLFAQVRAYSSFCEISPIPRFCYLSANQAILEAVHGEESVHIVDYDPRFGSQWAALLQDLASPLKPWGASPPHLRITIAGPDPVRLGFVADSLREFAAGLTLPRGTPRFHVIVCDSPAHLTPAALGLVEGEAVVFNFMLSLHRSLAAPGGADGALTAVTAAAPRLVVVAEQEVDDCDGKFQRRFVETLQYYAFVLDSLGPDDGEEIFEVEAEILSPDIRNAVSCEGRRRSERHLRLAAWRGRILRGGLEHVAVSDVARMQAECLIKRHPHGKNFEVVREDGGILLGWQGKNLVSVSAWAPADSSSAEGTRNNINNSC